MPTMDLLFLDNTTYPGNAIEILFGDPASIQIGFNLSSSISSSIYALGNNEQQLSGSYSLGSSLVASIYGLQGDQLSGSFSLSDSLAVNMFVFSGLQFLVSLSLSDMIGVDIIGTGDGENGSIVPPSINGFM